MHDWPRTVPEDLVKLLNCRNSRKDLGKCEKKLHAYKTIPHKDSLILMSCKLGLFNI